jgi:hypothetical protein
MRSNFDSPLKLANGVVEACGELDWSGETEAFVTVTIAQKAGKAVGGASSPSGFEPPEDEWMLEIESAGNKKFKEGPAQAVGVLSAVEGDTVNVFHWSQDVRLEEA